MAVLICKNLKGPCLKFPWVSRKTLFFIDRKIDLTKSFTMMMFSYPSFTNINPVSRKVWIMTALKTSRGKVWQTNSLWVILLAALIGCAASNYGRLTSNPDVTQAFQNHQVLPNHTYYYRGSHSRPFVVAGIQKDFVLDSPLWVEIDTQSKDFRTLIDRVSLQGTGNTVQPWGFTIIDSTGREIGVWYSAIRAAAIDVDENGRIVNLAPIGAVTRGNQGR